jgi:hypothetical protein
MKVITLINAATVATAAPASTDEGITLASDIVGVEGRDEIVTQVSATGSITIRIFGKLGFGMPWIQLGSDIIASGLYSFARVPKITAQVVAVTGTVTALAGF